jgi:hypothetical protein
MRNPTNIVFVPDPLQWLIDKRAKNKTDGWKLSAIKNHNIRKKKKNASEDYIHPDETSWLRPGAQQRLSPSCPNNGTHREVVISDINYLRHDVTEILLKVALYTIKETNNK